MSDVLDTKHRPSEPARRVAESSPRLLLGAEHHLCPGCGEPLVVRMLLEAIEELGLAQQLDLELRILIVLEAEGRSQKDLQNFDGDHCLRFLARVVQLEERVADERDVLRVQPALLRDHQGSAG